MLLDQENTKHIQRITTAAVIRGTLSNGCSRNSSCSILGCSESSIVPNVPRFFVIAVQVVYPESRRRTEVSLELGAHLRTWIQLISKF